MWPNLQETADLLTFTEEILNGKLNFLSSVKPKKIHLKNLKACKWYIFKTMLDVHDGSFPRKYSTVESYFREKKKPAL